MFKQIIHIDKNPNDPYKGWTWIEIDHEPVEKFRIPSNIPETYKKACKSREIYKYANNGNLPHRGRTGAKKFTLNIDDELITIKTHKSLTLKALISWIKTWIKSDNALLISPGGRAYPLNETKSRSQAHFIYFILNKDSNAIKIGRAKNVKKRMTALQTSSPAKLELIKFIQVEGKEKACELEQSLHEQFKDIRLNGEWFRAEDRLLDTIGRLSSCSII